MLEYIKIHPQNPQRRLLQQAVRIVDEGGIMVYPTDTNYGLGCGIFNRRGIERIMQFKRLPATHQFSILCADLSDISRYARVDNKTYRLLKRFLPGPYTFILEASRETPKTILPKRKTIGLRIPNHPICLGLLQEFGQPLLSTSMRLPEGDKILADPEEIRPHVEHVVDLLVDGGISADIHSTMVDLSGDVPKVLRVGAGDPAPFQ
ncbi:MAG: L-threonylcarbamoyladenylate synthase [Magnetococcus sp. DMHC-1]|nr:threonylcarbamoyl-AMP synthase [Magnetococcales bacterium]